MVEVIGALLGAWAADEKICLRKLKEAGAVSQELAVKPEEAGISGIALERALQRLIERGKIKKTEDDRYYVECEDKKQC